MWYVVVVAILGACAGLWYWRHRRPPPVKHLFPHF